ncbi:MAG: sulfotransferase domain-containing protein [Trichodesmium sp. MAG_R03]|nr:sulfotransferase domain-containing protein [Trichodesmium sp. MAG_R03]
MNTIHDIYAANQKLLKETDILLASYPRSGNTWMRMLLSDTLLQLQNIQSKTGSNIIPDIYHDSINKWNDYISKNVKFRIIKTHEPLFIKQKLDMESRVFYLFRKPADCLCSYYYYSLKYDKNQKNDKGIDEFCLERLEEWCFHVTTYISYQEKNPESIIFLSYEKLSYNPVKVLNYLVEFLGWENSQSVCQKSVDNQDFNKLHARSKDFFRKGKINSSQEELYPETLLIIQEKAMPIYRNASAFEPIVP